MIPSTLSKLLKDYKIKVSVWRSQIPDLNPAENVWAELKRHVRAGRPTKFHQFYQEEWAKSPACGSLPETVDPSYTVQKAMQSNSVCLTHWEIKAEINHSLYNYSDISKSSSIIK